MTMKMRTPSTLGFAAALASAVIAHDFLRSREEPDGIITPCPLPSGDAVRITDGSWRGLAAILERRVSARERVLVLLDILQCQARVEMPEPWVRLA